MAYVVAVVTCVTFSSFVALKMTGPGPQAQGRHKHDGHPSIDLFTVMQYVRHAMSGHITGGRRRRTPVIMQKILVIYMETYLIL